MQNSIGDWCKRTCSRGWLLAGVLVAAQCLAHGDEQSDAYQVVDVMPGVAMLQGMGGNIGVVTGRDGLLLIDDGYEKTGSVLQKALQQIAKTDRPEFVLNTHWHYDHAGSNALVGEGGSVIVAHDNVRKRLQSGGEIKALSNVIAPAAPAALPVLTFSEGMTVHWDGFTLVLSHPPRAHTDGDAVVDFYRDGKLVAVHTGDLFFNGFYPFIDASSGGSIQGLIEAVDALLKRLPEDVKLLPGHGPLGTVAELRAYQAFLHAAVAKLSALKQQGKSLTQAIAAKPLAEFEAEWGDGFLTTEQWIGIVYDML